MTHIEKQLNEFVGKKIRSVRGTLGITQETLGKELGVVPQQIQKYEKGENRMSAGKLFLLAEFYKVPMESFFPRQDAEEQLKQTRKLNKIYRMLNAIPEEHHDDVEAVLRAFQKICSGDKQYI